MTDAPRFGHAFAGHVRRTPEATALIWQDREISYAGLAELARHQVRMLDGIPPGEPVGILAAKSPDAVALVLACLLRGRRFLLPSPALAEDTLAELFTRAGCRTVLRTADLTPPDDRAGVPELPVGGTGSDEIGFMLTTSGSTGLPKIVPLPHRAVDAFTAWAGAEFDIGPGRTVLNYAPLNFDLCLLDIWTALAHGGRVVLVDTDRAVHGRHLLELLLRYRPDVVQAVPMFFGLVLDAVRGADAPADLSALAGTAHVMVTGDVIGERTLAGLATLFPRARLANIYGCTETNDSFMAVLPPGTPQHPPPLGRPLPGVGALIADDTGRPLDGPGSGELYVSTPFQSTGYLGGTRDADRFGPHPAGADDRTWFRTGDLVRRDADGEVWLIGRTDFQVKVRGVAINTAEVEAVLLDHPQVLEAAVSARADPVLGRQLVAAVRRRAGSGLNSLSIRRHCAHRLPRAAVPSQLRIVDEPLPRTSTGKVDRTAAGRMPDPAPTTGRMS